MHKVVSVSQVTRTSGRSHQICPHIFVILVQKSIFIPCKKSVRFSHVFFSPEALAQIPRVMYNKTEA